MLQTLSDTPLPQVREVPLSRPWRWMAQGLADFRRCPGTALVHGLACAAFGIALLLLARHRFWVLVGACSGFLLVAPLVATGLYEVSRRLERGERAGMADVLRVWRSVDGRLVRFGLLFCLAGTGWVLTSAALITLYAPAPIHEPLDFVRHVVLNTDHWLFEGWLLLGALLCAPVFASSVVSMPLLLDRRVGVLTAVLTSWRAVLASPAALAHWAFVLALLCGAGMALGMLGLVVVVPWLGHASWHAYRDLVEPEAGPR
jgi:uncharacterized membrane protein